MSDTIKDRLAQAMKGLRAETLKPDELVDTLKAEEEDPAYALDFAREPAVALSYKDLVFALIQPAELAEHFWEHALNTQVDSPDFPDKAKARWDDAFNSISTLFDAAGISDKDITLTGRHGAEPMLLIHESVARNLGATIVDKDHEAYVKAYTNPDNWARTGTPDGTIGQIRTASLLPG